MYGLSAAIMLANEKVADVGQPCTVNKGMLLGLTGSTIYDVL